MMKIFLICAVTMFSIQPSYALELSESSVQINCNGVNTSCVITDPDGLKFGLDSSKNYVEDFEGDYNVTSNGGGEIFLNLTKSGTYRVTFFSPQPVAAEARVFQNKYFNNLKGYGFTQMESPLEFTFLYRGDEALAELTKFVTLKSFLNDLDLVKKLGLVINSAVFDNLSRRIKDILNNSDGDIAAISLTDQSKLNAIINELKAQSGKALRGYSAEVLIYDINAILGSN